MRRRVSVAQIFHGIDSFRRFLAVYFAIEGEQPLRYVSCCVTALLVKNKNGRIVLDRTDCVRMLRHLGKGFGNGFRFREPFAGKRFGVCGANGLPNTYRRGGEKRDRGQRAGSENGFVPPPRFLEAIDVAWRAGADRFIVEVPRQVRSQRTGRFVTASPIFFERLHDDPIEVTTQQAVELQGFDLSVGG